MTITNTTKVGFGTFTLGELTAITSLDAQVTSLKVVPSVDNDKPIHVLNGNVVAGDRTETWMLEGSLLQDLGATDSVLEFLFDHRGEAMPFSYVPASGLGKAIKGSCVVEAIEMGGDVNAKASSDFKWEMVGSPVIEDLTIPGA